MKQRILLLLMGCARVCSAQTSETFDSTFLSADWHGVDSVFVVNASHQLQLNATAGGEAYLSKPSTTAFGEWEFWCRFQLSPSTSNLMRVYLMSDTSALNSIVHGYYVQPGGITGNNDSIVLYRQDGITRTIIIGGRVGTVSKLDNLVRIKVQRTGQGYWQLFSDTSGKHQYLQEGAAVDEKYTTSNYMGVYAKYTSSNGKRMFWDDLYAGDIRVDEEGPKLVHVDVISNTQLRLEFDEPLDEISALNPNAYEVNNGMGFSVSVGWGNDQQSVLLDLNATMSNQTYTLTVRGIEDRLGNTTEEQIQSFMYYKPQQNDIIISEWFPDPSPAKGLPEDEFVELYNGTSANIGLSGWTLSDGTTTVVFPDDTLYANSFAIVCAVADTQTYNPFGRTIGVSTLPSLNNSGDHLSLKSKDGINVYDFAYDLSWYHDGSKSDGGYSIELNSPNQLCKGKFNAGASDDESGGTPGRANSRWTVESDTTKPFIVWYSLVSSNRLRLVWNEPMDTVSLLSLKAQFKTTYIPASVSFKQDTVDVILGMTLHKDSSYSLNLTGAKDCSGNISSPTLLLQYLVADTPRLLDIVITEMMVDPDPTVGLPDIEYIELYNRSKHLISLGGWTVSDGSSVAILPNQFLFPDSFVVIVSSSKQSYFTAGIPVIGVTNFPSLGNESDSLVLKTPDGFTVFWLTYQLGWHTQTLKRNGGWSLEMIDANNPCAMSGNWSSSNHPSGGTPGKRNSIVGKTKDKQAPVLLRVFPVSDTELQLVWNESVDSTTLVIQRFQLSRGGVQSVQSNSNGFRSVQLTLNERLQKQTVYSLTVDSVADCVGNKMGSQRIEFGLPEKADSGDVVINELLFNPHTGGYDFVELYNRSNRILDASSMFVANRNSDGQIDHLTPLTTEGYLWFPHQYLVCSPELQWLKQNYTVPNPTCLLQTPLPSYSDDAGNCLVTTTSQILDELVYDEKMHLSILDNQEGVSLERIDFNRPSSDRSNWTSASTTCGFATPTSRNSQYATTSPSSFIKAEPSVFSPDGDGYHDMVNLSYTCQTVGSIGSFWVYNAAGQLVKQVMNNAVLGAEGVFSWDGIMDNGQRAPMGIYVGYFEVYNSTGKVDSEKITLVVAATL